MSITEQFKAVVSALPEFVLGAPDRWLMRVHSAFETGRDDPRVICASCKGNPEWPCEGFMRAERRHREGWGK